jgi:PAS domain S-box-containing protein
MNNVWLALPTPSLLQDAHGQVMQVNPAWERFDGRSAESLRGLRAGELISPEDPVQHEAQDERLRLTGQALTYLASRGVAGGEAVRLQVHKALLHADEPSESPIVTSVSDVTALLQAQEAMAQARDAALQASMARSEFMANISHELRTPLQAIIGFSQLGQRRARQDEVLAGLFTDVFDAGERMLRLVNDLLDLAKSEQAHLPMAFEFIDLRGLVRQVVRELRLLSEARNLTVTTQLGPAPLMAGVDPGRFQQVVRNVLANAIRFSPLGAEVTLTADVDPAVGITLSVADRGPGIPEAELEHIFDAFVQSSRTRDGSGGTGLGLAICRRILQAHGGRIHATLRAEGGSVFHITLPAALHREPEEPSDVVDITQAFEGPFVPPPAPN